MRIDRRPSCRLCIDVARVVYRTKGVGRGWRSRARGKTVASQRGAGFWEGSKLTFDSLGSNAPRSEHSGFQRLPNLEPALFVSSIVRGCHS